MSPTIQRRYVLAVRTYACLLLLSLVSCNALAVPEGLPGMGIPSEAQLAETTTAVVSADDLVRILDGAGLLSASLVAGSVVKTEPDGYAAAGTPEPDAVVSREFSANGQTAATVIISFFKPTYLYNVGLNAIADGIEGAVQRIGGQVTVPDGLGEQAALLAPQSAESASQLVFGRCHTVVHLLVGPGQARNDALLAYAHRIDQALLSVACQE